MMELTKSDKEKIKAFEKGLGYRFKQKELLKRALTHKSYANEQRLEATDHNERYEFLGDAVLELAISSLLMEQFPSSAEGKLSKLRAAIVNEERLALIARELHLGEFLYLGKGEERTGGREKPSLLSDALEAVFGAIYLDRGFASASAVIREQCALVLSRASGDGFVKDYKTRLQEEAQSRFGVIPRYRLVGESGPDHQKNFEVSLSLQGELLSTGEGLSKKAAEQDAAKKALQKLDVEMSEG